ncbi:hypothetical protein P376_2834 [Streptomyces sp. HCCB10043]|nr:hypothetical protein P376_2834 [Streptomyces sp. HCCB10043]
MEPVGLGDGEFGVPAGRRADMGDDALAEQARVGALAQRLDGPGDLAAGDGGQVDGGREGACLPFPQDRVQEVHAGRGHGDPDLAGAGNGVLGPLVHEVLGGAEGVKAYGVHEGLHGSRSGGHGPPLRRAVTPPSYLRSG